MRRIYVLSLVLLCACSSTKLTPLNPLNKAPDQQFFTHFNQWLQTKDEPYPEEDYQADQELNNHLEFTEAGLLMKQGRAGMTEFEQAITEALTEKKFKMPWIYISFKGHLSKRNTVHVIGYLNRSGIRYRFR